MTETERYSGVTPFQTIYDAFFNLVTDDMYLEWSSEDTYADIHNILLASITKFEFPRFKLYDFDEELSQFNFILDLEEINIIVYLMISEWITRQLATVDVTRQRYSSQDFEFTSQANHLAKLINLKNEYQKECKKIQRLYKRRKLNSDGYMVSNYSGLGGKNAN